MQYSAVKYASNAKTVKIGTLENKYILCTFTNLHVVNGMVNSLYG